LWKVRRPEVVKALADAAAEGDRSENAEYTYRKKQLGEIDRRVRYLSKRLEAVKVVEDAPSDPTAIYFGARIELEREETGEVLRYRIVGPDETDAARGWVSIDAPLARAALGRRADDSFEVGLPTGPERFIVLSVAYVADDGQR
jgi:transcription elongation factor GreB